MLTTIRASLFLDFKSGLKLSDSQNVVEFDSAIYNCSDPNKFVPNTTDGKFRVPCQRSGKGPLLCIFLLVFVCCAHPEDGYIEFLAVFKLFCWFQTSKNKKKTSEKMFFFSFS